MKKLRFLSSAAGAILLTVAVHAQVNVDTGTPNLTTPLTLQDWQYFGGEFAVTAPTDINQVEGFIGTDYFGAGSVTVSLQSDAGGSPGAVLDSSSFSLGGSTPSDWYGVSGLNWNVGPGNYWVSFTPDSSFEGTMWTAAPNPLMDYAVNFGGNTWYSDPGLDLGVRVVGVAAGDTRAAPDAASTALLAVISFAGLLVIRRQRA